MRKELLHDAFTVKRTLPLNNEHTNFNLPTLKLTESFPAYYLCETNNALIAPHGIVMHKGKIMPESVGYAWHGRANRKTFYKKLLLGKVKYVNNSCVVIHNSYYQNYYHWMLEAIPRLFSIKDRLENVSLLVPDNLSSFHHETLACFNLKETIPFSKGRLIWAKQLLFPMPPCPDFAQHNPELIKEMAAWLKTKLPVHKIDGKRFSDRILIIRGSDKGRKLVNQDDVIELLKQYNFTPVILEELTVQDQASIFSNAKCVVGVHGSGPANIIYMPQGRLVINFINKNHYDACIFNLANALDQKIIMQQCEPIGERNLHPQHYDIQADIDELKSYLDKYL